MAKQQTVKEFLNDSHVPYTIIQHTPAYTAPETAANCHISGKALAKVVIVKIDGKFAMIVETANQKVDFNALKEMLGANKIELASEYEFKDRFPNCELGAMPPFGNLYDMDVYVVDSLAHDSQIAFNAGTHSELIKMSYKDFEKLVHPQIIKH